MRYVVLLRGINVGGKNKIPMADLRRELTDAGFSDVQTYIQSGNVVLTATQSAIEVEDAIEELLPRRFTLNSASIMTLVLDGDRLRAVVDDAPPDFGAEPDVYHYDVAFLKGISGADVLPHARLHPEVDAVWAGPDAFYYRRVSALRTKSRINSIMSTPVYQNMTIRNWRTTTKLVAMLTD